ncbi:hypothetical protein BKA83DRAFT_4372855 [Pisolithus microcarpus]|nr:hypothetical protein BKA83DRAFT_4372855 [Pisolithus microcarpus]
MQNLHCREREDVHKHFDTLQDMREQLALMDQAPTDESFTAIIISSLPNSYQAQIGAVMALSKVTGTVITSDVLMATVLDAYDSQNLGSRKPSNKSGEDAAYTTSRDSKQRRINGNCYNCGKYGHMSRDCRMNKEKDAKEKDESSDSKGKSSEKAAVANESSCEASDLEPDGVWLAYGGYSSEDDEWSDRLTEVDEEDIPEIESTAMTASAILPELTMCQSCRHKTPTVTRLDSLLDGEMENEVDGHENELNVRRNLENDSKQSMHDKRLTPKAKFQVGRTNVYISGDTLPTGSRKYTFGTIEMRDDEVLQQNIPKTPIRPPEHPYETIPTTHHRKQEKTGPKNVIRRGADRQDTHQGYLEPKRSLQSDKTCGNHIRHYLGDPPRVVGEPPVYETDWGGSDSSSIAARRVAR